MIDDDNGSGSKIPAGFLTDEQTAQLLNKSVAWLRRNRPRLVRTGFPDKHAILRLTHRAGAEEWVARQHITRLQKPGVQEPESGKNTENLDVL